VLNTFSRLPLRVSHAIATNDRDATATIPPLLVSHHENEEGGENKKPTGMCVTSGTRRVISYLRCSKATRKAILRCSVRGALKGIVVGGRGPIIRAFSNSG
jgi:hypothetical protein